MLIFLKMILVLSHGRATKKPSIRFGHKKWKRLQITALLMGEYSYNCEIHWPRDPETGDLDLHPGISRTDHSHGRARHRSSVDTKSRSMVDDGLPRPQQVFAREIREVLGERPRGREQRDLAMSPKNSLLQKHPNVSQFHIQTAPQLRYDWYLLVISFVKISEPMVACKLTGDLTTTSICMYIYIYTYHI